MVKRSTLRVAVLCAFLCEALCSGADYYVDAEGDDANDGLTPSTAWRTVSKVNSRTFAAGDRILFKRGQTWREQLIVPSSGAVGNPITFGAYGSGARPVLKGSALISSWTSAGGNVWRGSLSATPNQVFFSGVRGTQVSGTAGVSSALKWYWTGGTLYVYATSNPGSTIEASVRPSTRSYGVLHIQNCSYVTIESFEVTQSASFGLYIKPAASYITVKDCEVSHSLDGGLVAPRAGTSALSQITVEDCLVHHNNGGFKEGAPGVTTYHEGLTMENVDGFVIRRTKVYNNYMEGCNFKRGARNGLIEYCDLYANGLINQYIEGATNIELRYNRYYDCSYNAGLEFGMETDTYHNDNVRIHHNLFWNNTGGVSFWAGGFTGQHRNFRIENNTFYNNWEAIRFKSGATDNISGTNYIRNNLFWQGSTSNRAIWDYTSGQQAISRTTIAYNAFQQGAATATTGSNAKMLTTSGMVSPAGYDFHLRSDSGCINAGTNVGWTADMDGTVIPQGGVPDISADEYGSGGAVTSYTLTVSAVNGAVTKTPNQTSYTAGQTVSLQATANSGYTFSGWSGALTGTANPASLAMDSDCSVTADFTADTYSLAISAANGFVTMSPDKAGYTQGEMVTLQATPDVGYSFTGWSGDLTGATNPVPLVMDSNKSVTAGFTANTYTLTINAANGSIIKSPDKAGYAYGEIVTLQATADTGYSFTGWSGDASGIDDSTTVAMNADKSVTASFVIASSDEQPPVLTDCMPAPDSIQVARNSLVILHLCDEGRGVDAASVSILVNGSLVYAGDVDRYRSAVGICQRAGTKADYAYTYQQSKLFLYDTQVVVSVTARDLAGNAASGQAYSFATEMHAFGQGRKVSEVQVTSLQGKPAAAGDDQDGVWIVWHEGETGQRQVYAARVAPDNGTGMDATQISQGAGDHCNPAVARDDAGVAYVIWQEDTRGAWNVCVSTSGDGLQWSEPARVMDSNDNQVNPAIARGTDGLVAVAWQDDRAGNQDIYVAASRDRFATTAISRLTSDGADQTDPAIAIDNEGGIIVLWTDARNNQTGIYGAASDHGPWANLQIVDTDAAQSQPAIAAGLSGVLHMVWVEDIGGDPDILYAASNGLPASPLTGVSIVDDTCGADQQMPVVIAAAGADGTEGVFACWQDSRNLASSGDTDLYFVDLSPGSLRTNVLVDDRGTNTDQRDVSLAVDGLGHPYVVWADDAEGKSWVYCSGTTYTDSVSRVEREIPAVSGEMIVGTPPQNAAGLDDVSVVIPSQACPFDVTIDITPIRNPQGRATQSLSSYEFGPSGLTFAEPVTITIPYGAQAAGRVRACWFDHTTGTFSEQGVTDVQSIQVRPGLYALRFKTTHFTPFYIVSAESAGTSGGGGGGCSLAAGQEGDPAGYFVPYLILAMVMAALRCRDRQRRLARPDGPQADLHPDES